MAEKTGIEWTDATWNPWQGCHKVSPGCKNCYMFRDMTFYGKDPNTVRRSSDATFRAPLTWAKNGKVKEGGRIFTCSWSDWFIEEADAWRQEAWKIIKATPQYTYLILTKRIERAAEHLPKDWGSGYPNVWLGVSAENQKYADERIPMLLDVPAHIRWISAEPLLGDISFWVWFPLGTVKKPPEAALRMWTLNNEYENGLHWIVTGGESDKTDPRLIDLNWVRSIRDQCKKAGVAFFHKQHGGTKKINKTWGGRELDGKTHNEFPL